MFCSWGKAVKGQRFSNLKALTHPKLRQLNKHVGCTLCALQFDLNCRPPLLHQRQGLSYIYIYIWEKHLLFFTPLWNDEIIVEDLQAAAVLLYIYTTSFQYIDFCFICTCICWCCVTISCFLTLSSRKSGQYFLYIFFTIYKLFFGFKNLYVLSPASIQI